MIEGDGSTATDRRFHVLSLDGGGVRGIFTAALLAALEEDLGESITRRFDLIVGTSTGGIIALGLGLGLRPREILDAYLMHRKTIFPDGNWWRTPRHWFRSKYDSDGLSSVCREIFGDAILGDSQVPLVVPSYNLGDNDVYVFKTPHHSRLRRDWRVPMWAVAMATSAAPTYFPAFQLPDSEVRLVDGGVWANNPAMVGVVEAVSMFGESLKSIRVLSVGTGVRPQARPRRLDAGGIWQWARGVGAIDVLLRGQGIGAFAQVQHLIGANDALRLDPLILDAPISLDGGDPRDLVARASHHSRLFSPQFKEFLGNHTPRSYRPYYGRQELNHDH